MDKKTIYALGFFDGVHLGHQALLRACRALAEETGAYAGVVTFDGHPEAVISGNAPGLINTLSDRKTLLEQYGMEQIVALPFDRALMQMPWQDFFRMLVQQYGAGGLVCGVDFRFGSRGEGDAAKLRQACLDAGIPCTVVPEQLMDGIRVSSTHIRTLLEGGQMEQAVRFLGHPHILSGTVISGRHLGRTLGIPTANLALPEQVVCPRRGVYACTTELEGQRYLAVTNVGSRPTVGGHHITVEPWILDFAGDLYGKPLHLAFHAFLRPEKKFDSVEDLKGEIRKNALQTKTFFAEK